MAAHIEFDFGLAWQSLAALAMFQGLADSVFVFGEHGLRELDDLNLLTRPLYQCRERGVCFLVSHGNDLPTLVIWFAQHRRSDELFVQTCEVDEQIWSLMVNWPPPDLFTQQSYEARRFYRETDIRNAVHHIYQAIGLFYGKQAT